MAMSIDEAIKHAKEVAEEQKASSLAFEQAETFKRRIKHNTEARLCELSKIECQKCAEEHQQLAEWLKDYKNTKAKLDKIKQIVKATCYEEDGKVYSYTYDLQRKYREIFEVLKDFN